MARRARPNKGNEGAVMTLMKEHAVAVDPTINATVLQRILAGIADGRDTK